MQIPPVITGGYTRPTSSTNERSGSNNDRFRDASRQENRPTERADSGVSVSETQSRQNEPQVVVVEEVPASLAIKEDSLVRSFNAKGSIDRAVNSYQQIEQVGRFDLESSDPSLFRVDLFV